MIKTGLTSISHRQLEPTKIISLAVQANLNGIEWGGDIHVPHGDTKIAREVGKMTTDAGLDIIAYGSYFRLGNISSETPEFKSVLDSAVALQASVIRVWAGDMGSAKADENYWNKVVGETKNIAKLAAQANIEIAFESHLNSLTDTGESSVKLLEEVNCENVKTYWQTIPELSDEENLKDLNLVFPWLKNVHVFQWLPEDYERCSLSDGTVTWQKYFKKIKTMENDVYAILEFVKNDSPNQLLIDADTLNKLIN